MPILFVIKNRKAFHSGLKLSCNKQQKPGEECPMQALHKVNHESNSNDAITKLFEFIDQRRHSNEPVSDVAEFERKLREVFAAAECDLLAKELEKLDTKVRTTECRASRSGSGHGPQSKRHGQLPI
jgi:hypothetical protein